jgi:hypothetical protein
VHQPTTLPLNKTNEPSQLHCYLLTEKKNAYWVLVGKAEGDHLEDQDVGERLILQWILEEWDGMDWIHLA